MQLDVGHSLMLFFLVLSVFFTMLCVCVCGFLTLWGMLDRLGTLMKLASHDWSILRKLSLILSQSE